MQDDSVTDALSQIAASLQRVSATGMELYRKKWEGVLGSSHVEQLLSDETAAERAFVDSTGAQKLAVAQILLKVWVKKRLIIDFTLSELIRSETNELVEQLAPMAAACYESSRHRDVMQRLAELASDGRRPDNLRVLCYMCLCRVDGDSARLLRISRVVGSHGCPILSVDWDYVASHLRPRNESGPNGTS